MSLPPAIRVVLIDDHPALRAGVRAALEREGNITVVGEAAGGIEGVEAIRRLEPNVVLLDMEMPDMDGIEVAAQLRASKTPTRILAYSAYDDANYVTAMLQAGAAGYVTKDKPMALVAEAVEAVARGEGRWFVSVRVPEQAANPLSDRELEVIRLMARGHDNRSIGELLAISHHTVRNHISSAYEKLDVSSWRQAVAWAWQHGLVGSEEP